MTEYKNVMLIDPDTVKSQSDINYNVEDTAIGASIRVSQNIYLRDIIGDALLERLQVLVYNAIEGNPDSIDDEANIAYKTLLDDYISNFLTYKVAVEICDRLSLKIRNMGVVKNADTNISPADLGDIIYLKEKYETFVNDAANRMVKFICGNSAAYPESDFVCGCDKSPKYGRTGLWLG